MGEKVGCSNPLFSKSENWCHYLAHQIRLANWRVLWLRTSRPTTLKTWLDRNKPQKILSCELLCCPSRIKICFMTSLGCHNIEHLSQIHGRHLWIQLWNSQNRNSMINKLNPFFQCSYTWRCKYLYMSKLLLVVYNNSEENRLKIPLQNIFEIRSNLSWAICGVIKTLQIVLVGTYIVHRM